MAEVSIIIPSLKPKNEIAAVGALEADASAEYELIIRDDEGAATARNQGIREATTNKLIFLDDDSRAKSGYLNKISDLLDDHAIVAGRIVDPGDDYFARMAPNYGYDQGDESHFTDIVVGCNMAVRREVFETVGGFDERIEWGHEDTLFGAKASKQFDIYYDPDLVVEHRFCESAIEYWRKQWRYGRADVYAARVRDNPVFSNWHELLPVSGDSTLQGVAVKSAGKSLRIIGTLLTLIKTDGIK